ncbi:leucine--tRNA ligase [Methanosphaera cuniculi]|uniref:Leucine--tRNA ligase n=1 Tax=Methanosphaera cuniculi TaxID=1077256 RepID=A0A2A2HD44_9EURY|nr:leucine--tRNA ligase [Methanosphaera cuniculi]PAV07305.1 leucine--tRNA ligase [Methanosphaera cuniculi]PWL07874.1 valine--tRNA ligase [Methanosphaera cuniculi]
MVTELEKKWQKKWQDAKIFESNPDEREKMYLTVAFPYPSGAMHVGHGRTYTVPDVYARFKRMQGYNVLFPMAWHVTGAPVVGIAKRIERKDPWTIDIYQNIHQVPEDELKKFTDPEYIVKYFSNEYHNDMTNMGFSIDWRREFRTIDPHYKQFVRWQIRQLKDKNLIHKGSHPVKYCPDDDNPVGDHDLLEGEGVAINDLTLIKFPYEDSYLVAATFRPETLYGATNVWLNPEAEYVKVKYNDETWIISRKAYDNIIYQKESMEIIEDVNPREFIGKTVKNPITDDTLPIFPASFVDPDYATGVVFSVPAHAPADYIALEDIKADTTSIEEFNLQDHIDNINMISLVDLKGYSEFPAKDFLDQFNVTSQDDENLKEATNEIYKKEHAKGIMNKNTGEFEGRRVADVRDDVRKMLIDENIADTLYEFAEKPVICRCGSKCVVKELHDQWFVKYSDEKWTEETYECLEQLDVVPKEVRSNFEYYLGWLEDWACSRRLGLGTHMPWDEKWLIEPLTDSTIYMAYYTIAKFMKQINADDLNDAFFNKVFLNQTGANDKSENKIPEELTQQIQDEFNYWYPLNWRLSAKDLVGNHLSFHMFHHAAIFPREKWPQGITVFGMGLLEGQKMSSSKGNVILLSEAIDKYGADTVRLFLMSSAEPWQDFDWRATEVNGIQRRLEAIEEFPEKIEKLIGEDIKLTQENNIPKVEKPINKWIISQINRKIVEATEALEGFQTRKALQASLFLMRKDIDYYLKRITEITDEEKQTLIYIINTWIRLLSPFIPYTAEEIWDKYNDDDTFMSLNQWPEANLSLIDEKVEKSEEIIQDLTKDVKEIIKITKSNPETIHLYTTEDWKYKVYDIAEEVGKPNVGEIIQRSMKANLYDNKKELSKFATKTGKSFNKINYVGKIDEYQVINDALEYLEDEIGAKIVVHNDNSYDPQNKAPNATPYKPAIYLE